MDQNANGKMNKELNPYSNQIEKDISEIFNTLNGLKQSHCKIKESSPISSQNKETNSITQKTSERLNTQIIDESSSDDDWASF
jgi:hypothetical protein